MTEPFIGEIQIFGFPFAPQNWAFAAGQMMPVRQYMALFSLYGINFGGDGTTTFGLPNLAGRQACGSGQGQGTQRRSLGEAFGSYGVTLTSAETPMHNHTFSDYQPEDSLSASPAAGSAIGYAQNITAFATPGTTIVLDPNAIGTSGSGASHENRQPFLGLNYSVALVGNYPMFD